MSRNITRIYSLTLASELDAEFIAAHCPAGTALARRGKNTRLDNLETDQAGILGIIRALHNLGILVLQLNTSTERNSQ